jgi:serine/threonine-protein kinase RsbW
MHTALYGARLESLAAIRRFVEDGCVRAGVSPDRQGALVLAVDEACTNIIEHGYAGRDPGQISISLDAEEDGVRVRIADSGRAFDPASAEAPDLAAGWEERPIGGLGWHLIRQTVDEVRYRSDETGNVLTLILRPSVAPSNGVA